MAEFMERYGTQEQCHAALVASRWPDGFFCPDCGCSRHSTFLRDELRYWQCSACREQTTVTSGTAFQATKLPLTSWFPAMHLLTQAKNNVSALELKRHLGVRYKAAWLMKHKLLQVIVPARGHPPPGWARRGRRRLPGRALARRQERAWLRKQDLLHRCGANHRCRPAATGLPAKAQVHQGGHCHVGAQIAVHLGRSGLRWAVVLPGRHRRRRHPQLHSHWRWRGQRQAAAVQRSQYLARQSEDRIRRNLPFVRLREICSSLSRRGPIPIQSSIRFVRHSRASPARFGRHQATSGTYPEDG